MIWWRGFIYITYDCEDNRNNQDNGAIKTVANKIPCWWKKHEKGCNGSCEEKLNRNNDVNFPDETPSELRWLYHRRIKAVAMCLGKSSLNVTLTHGTDRNKQTTSKTKNWIRYAFIFQWLNLVVYSVETATLVFFILNWSPYCNALYI